jgi:hypothetical protein
MLTAVAVEALVLGLVVAVLALAGAVVLLGLRLRRLGSDQRRAFDGVEVDVLAALARHTRRLDGVDAALEEVRSHGSATRTALGGALTRLAIVRYDAFDDVGGELSFSAALLDEHDDGLVITAINGRAEGRTYAKLVSGGTTTAMLSDEERAAIGAAQRGGRTEERVDGRGSRRWRDRERA